MKKKKEIIEAAVKRFRYYGVSKTSMQEIAQDLDIAVGTLYLNFKSKNDLILACIDEFANKHKEVASEIIKSSLNPSEKLIKYVLNRFHATEETRKDFPHSVEITRMVFKLRPNRVEEDIKWLTENITKILTEGVSKGLYKIDNPVEDAVIFLHSISTFFPMATQEPLSPPSEEMLLKVINWFIKQWSR